MARVIQYWSLLTVAHVVEYCKAKTAEERSTIICSQLANCVVVYDAKLFNLDVESNVFKYIGNCDNETLKSVLSQYVGVSMIALRKTSSHSEKDLEMLKELATRFPKTIQELDHFAPETIGAFKMKLSLPEHIVMDSDLDGIHFINGRYDLKTGNFHSRQWPSFQQPHSFVSKVIPYPFGPMVMDDCNRIYTMLLQTFGSREKLDYMLYYAGAALSGRSPSQSCSCMFAVGRGGCGKTTFMNMIKAAVTDVYFTDLPLDSFDNMKTANRVFSVISPCVRFLFASELNKAPKKASILKTICDGEISCTRLYSNGSFNMKVNAKLMGTSNNAIMFDEDDTGIARRVQYCLHENKFVDDDALVDGVHVFKKIEFEPDAVSLQDRLAMFHLIAHHAATFDDSSMAVRPDGIHNGETLFDIKAFIAEYFVTEAGAKVPKEHVMQLAKTYFSHLEFNEDFIINKLLKFKVQPYITHSANRSHEGCRNILVNIRLNDKHKPAVVNANTADFESFSAAPASSVFNQSAFGGNGGFGGHSDYDCNIAPMKKLAFGFSKEAQAFVHSTPQQNAFIDSSPKHNVFGFSEQQQALEDLDLPIGEKMPADDDVGLPSKVAKKKFGGKKSEE